jgi:hypothetical protein
MRRHIRYGDDIAHFESRYQIILNHIHQAVINDVQTCRVLAPKRSFHHLQVHYPFTTTNSSTSHQREHQLIVSCPPKPCPKIRYPNVRSPLRAPQTKPNDDRTAAHVPQHPLRRCRLSHQQRLAHTDPDQRCGWGG